MKGGRGDREGRESHYKLKKNTVKGPWRVRKVHRGERKKNAKPRRALWTMPSSGVIGLA